MVATVRSLRPLLRHASPAMRRLPVISGAALQTRMYGQPARDLMTGEVTQLPDIDVSLIAIVSLGNQAESLAHYCESQYPALAQTKASSFEAYLWNDIYGSYVDHTLE